MTISDHLQAMASVEKMMAAAERLQEQETFRILQGLFQSLRENMTAPEVVRMISINLVMKSLEVLRELGADTDIGQQLRGFLRTEPKSLAGLEHILKAYLTEFMSRLRIHKEASSGHPLRGIECYIQENYRKPITIKEIGEQFFMNPVYLGQAFMKKNGIGIIECIDDLRIDEAKRRLQFSNDTIRSIAEDIGYVHYHHFLREFEKRVPEKPIKYRQISRF